MRRADALVVAFVILVFTAAPAPALHGGVAVSISVDERAATPKVGVRCKNGKADGFPCHKIDLMSHLAPSEIGGSSMAAVWGWRDPETKREYALVGKSNGLAIVDVTSPTKPVYLGDISKTDPVRIWVDVEVYKDHAFIVSESVNGMMVFDLTRLRGTESAQPWTPDFVYPVAPSSHTLRLDTESGFAYLNGTTGTGIPHIVDISDPKQPKHAGMISDDGYVHDSHCVVYRGPAKDYRKKEICLTQNEDTLNIYDVSDKSDPQRLARESYQGAAYTHSGWLTKDHRYFLLSDEADEQRLGSPTTTYIWDVRDLTEPELIATYHGETTAIDHNIYIEGKLAYQAAYTSGLRILDTSRVAKGKLKEVAYFDVIPEHDNPVFDGSWGAYPFLPSGNVLLTGMGQGFFVVRPRL